MVVAISRSLLIDGSFLHARIRDSRIFLLISLSRSLSGEAEHVHGGNVAEPGGDDAHAVHGTASPAAAAVPDVQSGGAADRREFSFLACLRSILALLLL